MTNTEKAKAMLAIVREIYEGGKEVIGPQWTVYDKMAALASRGDVDGMVQYFDNCRGSERGRQVHWRLERAGKKSLESEERRFMAIAGA